MTTMAVPTVVAERSELQQPTLAKPAKKDRVTSIDAARGFIMLTMIFVNDFSGVPDEIAPWWMKHMDERQPPLKVHDGMTFVDMVFPGFLFMVGMSIPFAIGGRLKRGEAWWKILLHVTLRTIALLALGIMMVNGEDGPTSKPWLSHQGWVDCMFLAGILAFVEIRPRVAKLADGASWNHVLWAVRICAAIAILFCQPWSSLGRLLAAAVVAAIEGVVELWMYLGRRGMLGKENIWKYISWAIRVLGVAGLVTLALVYARTEDGDTERLLSFGPLAIRTSWFGILGIIGWAYLAGAILYLLFKNSRLALALCVVFMMGMYAADRTGSFRNWGLPGFLSPLGDAFVWCVKFAHKWLGRGFDTSGGIVVAGTLLATVLVTPDTTKTWARIKFALWFIAATAFAAMMFYKPYLIWKDSGTPAWSLWACCFTATLWLGFYLVGDVLKWKWLTSPFAVAGQNVLFAYLISEGVVGWMDRWGIGDWYGHLGEINLALAITRSLMIGVVILAVVSLMNWLGVRLRL